MLCDCYHYAETVTEIKLHIKTSPAFHLHLFAYSYRLFEKFNRAPLNCSREALLSLPRWQIHTCSFIQHSHQKLSCLKSGASYSSTESLPINQEYSTPLLRQLNAVLETVWNQLTIRPVFKTIANLQSLELLYSLFHILST